MTIFIFGNPDLPIDSLPIRILPKLQKAFPKIQFIAKDPHDDWEMPKELIMIDTVLGIKKVKIFSKLNCFAPPPRFSLHDFDLISQLRFLKKLKRLPKKFKIIGLPVMISEKEALKAITVIINTL
jgi:hypothetical protein